MATAQKRARPNYFIAVPITNPEIICKVSELQRRVTQQALVPPWTGLRSTHIFKGAMMPVSKLHFTLNVMPLRDERELQMYANQLSAQIVLAEVGSVAQQDFKDNPMHLTIDGLTHLANSVVVAKIKESSEVDRLTKLHELFQKKFNEHLGIPIDERSYRPHITIANTSRDRSLLRKRIKHFPPEMWSSFENTTFGTEHVTKIQLLQMGGSDSEYYRSYGEYSLGDCSGVHASVKSVK